MGENAEEFESLVQYSAANGAANIAALGFQVFSFVGNRIREASIALAGTNSSESSPATPLTHNVSQSVNDRRWLRKSSNSFIIEELPVYTLNDVAFHDSPYDCWIILYDRIYDVTSFLRDHPGGEDVMLEYAGRDATLAFRSVGHSKMAEDSLKPFLVGILVEKERIWTRFFNMKSDMP